MGITIEEIAGFGGSGSRLMLQSNQFAFGNQTVSRPPATIDHIVRPDGSTLTIYAPHGPDGETYAALRYNGDNKRDWTNHALAKVGIPVDKDWEGLKYRNDGTNCVVRWAEKFSGRNLAGCVGGLTAMFPVMTGLFYVAAAIAGVEEQNVRDTFINCAAFGSIASCGIGVPFLLLAIGAYLDSRNSDFSDTELARKAGESETAFCALGSNIKLGTERRSHDRNGINIYKTGTHDEVRGFYEQMLGGEVKVAPIGYQEGNCAYCHDELGEDDLMKLVSMENGVRRPVHPDCGETYQKTCPSQNLSNKES